MLGKRHELALGIIATPADRTARANIRASWLLAPAFADGRATARFVLGDVPCARAAVKGEKALHGDIAFVNASDCSPWHAGHKVHAWYQWALRRLPALWYGKAEDDSFIGVEMLLAQLRALRRPSARSNGYLLYGINPQWVAHCRQLAGAGARSWTDSAAARSCAQGCWLGTLEEHRQPQPCVRGFDGAAVAPGSEICPLLSYAPFVPGPLEVRSTRLAALVANCGYAADYFASLVARGARTRDECASGDGSQGLAIRECAAERLEHLLVADGGSQRQAYASSATFALLERAAANINSSDPRARREQRAASRRANAPAQLTAIHPIKPDRSAETWRTLWALLTAVQAPRADRRAAGGSTARANDDRFVLRRVALARLGRPMVKA